MCGKYEALLSYIRLWLRPRRRRLALSLTAGLLALVLSAGPMWWGVLFSPLSLPLTSASETAEAVEAAEAAEAAETEEAVEGFSFRLGDQVFRFKALDLILELFS